MEQTPLSEQAIPVHLTAESAQQAAAAAHHPMRERIIGLVVTLLAGAMVFIAFAGWSTASLVNRDSIQSGVLAAVFGLAVIEALIWIAGGVLVMLRSGRVARIAMTARWGIPIRIGGVLAACAWGVHVAV